MLKIISGVGSSGNTYYFRVSHTSLLSGILQVWSQTQSYSVDFSQSRFTVNKCVYNKAQAQSRFTSGDFGSDLERPCQA